MSGPHTNAKAARQGGPASKLTPTASRNGAVSASVFHGWLIEGQRLFAEAERTGLARDRKAVTRHFAGIATRLEAGL